jgi:hypothetical protein
MEGLGLGVSLCGTIEWAVRYVEHTRQDKAGQFRESPQLPLGGFSLRPSPLSWRTCSPYRTAISYVFLTSTA